MLHTHLRLHTARNRKDKRAKPGILPRNHVLLEIGEYFVEKCSHVSLSRLHGHAVASLSPRRSWFSLRVVSERCMVDREALGRGFLLIQCPLDYPVCGLSMHDRKLIMTNDEGRK